MKHCDHDHPKRFTFPGGKGMEWCPICGAIRHTEYANMKNGGLQTTTQWTVPFRVDAEWVALAPTQSVIKPKA